MMLGRLAKAEAARPSISAAPSRLQMKFFMFDRLAKRRLRPALLPNEFKSDDSFVFIQTDGDDLQLGFAGSA